MRRLRVDVKACRGCLSCELACSFRQEKEFDPAKARLYVIKDEWENIMLPVICTQCGRCAAVCPKEAISQGSNGVWYIAKKKCDGCGDCLKVCPTQVMFLHPDTAKATMCDLCDGDPECVRFCPYEAISFLEQSVITRLMRGEFASKVISKKEERV